MLPQFTQLDSPKDNERYMCTRHLQFFKQQLLNWQKELLHLSNPLLEVKRENGIRAADILDQSVQQLEVLSEFRESERKSRILYEIDLAFGRIESGEYGYCEITGEEIGLRRLAARPTATRCI